MRPAAHQLSFPKLSTACIVAALRCAAGRAAIGVVVCSMVACGSKEEPAPPVATPSFQMNVTRVPLGSPVEITYRFAVEPNAPPFTKDYLVMVHVLDSDEELMWTDDHQPPTPTRQWKPGQMIEYTRTVFFPVYPYLGTASVEMGLYARDTGERLPLAGQDTGQRSYRVGTVELLPQTENIFVIFKEGWHPPETAENNATLEWQWMKKDGTLQMRNPMRDVLFYLHADHPRSVMTDPQHVVVTIGDQTIDDFSLNSGEEVIRKVPLTAAQLGSGETTAIHIHVDRTFVPAVLAPDKTKDPRELGLRVFHAFIQPR